MLCPPSDVWGVMLYGGSCCMWGHVVWGVMLYGGSCWGVDFLSQDLYSCVCFRCSALDESLEMALECAQVQIKLK